MTYRNANSRRTRSYRRSGQAWSPGRLAPYAWYDVHLGGTSSTIADTSGNGRADATYGATTAAPLYLPYTGTAYLHLEAAGSGTNSLSCTAPANTASYAAYPLGGGAATTGAASAGAFTFTTAGDWTQVDLLDGSAVVLASFRASDSGQTGHTDAFSVAWTINRGTAGGKSTLVNRRSLALLRTDDYIVVPAAAIPALDTYAAASSVVAVFRRWHNPGTNRHPIFTTKSGPASTTLGIGISMPTTAAATAINVFVADGSVADSVTSASVDLGLGTRGVVVAMVGDASPFVSLSVNGAAALTDTSRGTTTTTSTGGAGRIGAYTFGGSPMDMEFEALLTFDRALTAGEASLLTTYYAGGS